MRVDQIVPTFIANDGVYYESLTIKRILNNNGIESVIYYDVLLSEEIKSDGISYKEINKNIDRIIIYHYAIWNDILESVINLPGKKILFYHNITPYQWFADCDETIKLVAKKGREKLSELVNHFDLVIAESNFSKQELVEKGFRNIEILPYIVDFTKYNISPTEIPYNKNIKGKLIYVGRIAPNKMIDELIMIYYYYKKSIETNSKFVIIGDYSSPIYGPYYSYLRRLIKYMQLEDIIFTDKVSLSTLVGYYRWADIFITMSQHEGFCTPLLESMYFNVPVIARNACAIPETLGEAGILIKTNDYREIAEIIHECIINKKLREKLIRKQNERLKDFDLKLIEKKLIEHIDKINR